MQNHAQVLEMDLSFEKTPLNLVKEEMKSGFSSFNCMGLNNCLEVIKKPRNIFFLAC
ncbi:hypothetical protein AM1BK_22220 [Neobacillus kokaensis]|uniref:Uncharacterized protein n=1 Tax=Neobacillus kokaensis TaxID=2759023 RepID=A0ABQ3N273_9BACI|nr:hypothetical protein AM1BK_22220 [Neobacillus kokaensis]